MGRVPSGFLTRWALLLVAILMPFGLILLAATLLMKKHADRTAETQRSNYAYEEWWRLRAMARNNHEPRAVATAFRVD